MKNKICIELHTDNNYVMPTIVTLASLFANKKPDSVYEVRVLGNNLTPENIELLEKQLDGHGKVIPHISNFSKFEGKHPYVSSTDLFKFDLPDVLSDWDKVLYIDTDMIIQSDLSELFNTDLQDNYIAAVKDIPTIKGNGYNFSLDIPNYFNAGMMLMNLKKMRKENIGKKLIDYKLHKDCGHFMSQDALNVTFKGNVLFLDPKYNFMPKYVYSHLSTFLDFFKISQIDFNTLLTQAIIIHYADACKPWKFYSCLAGEIWRNYYNQSILANTAIQFLDVWHPKWFGWLSQGDIEKFYFFKIPVIRIKKSHNKKKIYFLGIRIKK